MTVYPQRGNWKRLLERLEQTRAEVFSAAANERELIRMFDPALLLDKYYRKEDIHDRSARSADWTQEPPTNMVLHTEGWLRWHSSKPFWPKNWRRKPRSQRLGVLPEMRVWI